MVPESKRKVTVCVVGLGYVGGALAEAFSRHVTTLGIDINQQRVEQIRQLVPEVQASTDPAWIKRADYVLICVPTPVAENKQPDLTPVISAAKSVGKNLKPGAIIVLESTVYPGLTEEVVLPILEQESGLRCGRDFFIGYSPERINPGDDVHTLAKITKVVAGMDEATLQSLADLYGLVTTVYRAPSIQVAESAKVIENIQRDLNIALMNELAVIFDRLGIDTREVLKAAGTKWNFLPFVPGLVGGHCIPVDPYYLVARAQEFGYHPQVILAGRSINDSMPAYVAMKTIKALNEIGKTIKGSKVLILGITYKENVPDIRESPARGLVKELKEFGVEIFGFDPFLSTPVIEGFGLTPFTFSSEKLDGIIITVAHEQFRTMDPGDLMDQMNTPSVLVDVKGILDRDYVEKRGIYYVTL